MKNISVLIISFLLIACGSKEHDLVVKTTIEGLKKGIVYLKKVEDTLLVTVDSIAISGTSSFELYSDLESPEIFFLDLDKNSKEENRIRFFADKGVTEIYTSLKNFTFDAEIKGSKHHDILEGYQSVIKKLNNRNLDLIKMQFDARKDKDTLLLQKLIEESKTILKRKYLFTVNYALSNKDSEVSPFLALTEIYHANITYLDTINNSLTSRVKRSKYGKQLEAYINQLKQNNSSL